MTDRHNDGPAWPYTLCAHATTYGVAVERVERAGRLHGNQVRRVGAKPTRQRKRRAVKAWKAGRERGESFKAWMGRKAVAA